MRSCETRCARTSSLLNLYYVCHPLYPSCSIGLELTSLFPEHEPEPEPVASNPPPRDLKVSDPAVRDLTLGELGLAPSSILHLRFVDDGLNRERSFSSGSFGSSSPLWWRRAALPCPALPCPAPPEKFRSGLISFFETSPGSDLPAPLASAVLEHAVDLPAPSSFDGNQKKEDAPPPTASASSSSGARDKTGGDVKIPKWLKLGSSKSLSMRRSPRLPCNPFLYSEK